MVWPALEAFDAECAAFAERVSSVAVPDLDRITNCPPWTLHELVVHVTFSITLPERLRPAPDGFEPRNAADYYRRPERDTDTYRTENVDRMQSIAATVARDDAASRFLDAWKRAHATFLAHEQDERIAAGGMALTVDSFLVTRLMSVAAHGVDVVITLDEPAWTTASALACLRPLLVDLLGAEPPASWTDQDLLELGTGRRPLETADVEALGEHAARFPLLS